MSESFPRIAYNKLPELQKGAERNLEKVQQRLKPMEMCWEEIDRYKRGEGTFSDSDERTLRRGLHALRLFLERQGFQVPEWDLNINETQPMDERIEDLEMKLISGLGALCTLQTRYRDQAKQYRTWNEERSFEIFPPEQQN